MYKNVGFHFIKYESLESVYQDYYKEMPNLNLKFKIITFHSSDSIVSSIPWAYAYWAFIINQALFLAMGRQLKWQGTFDTEEEQKMNN